MRTKTMQPNFHDKMSLILVKKKAVWYFFTFKVIQYLKKQHKKWTKKTENWTRENFP